MLQLLLRMVWVWCLRVFLCCAFSGGEAPQAAAVQQGSQPISCRKRAAGKRLASSWRAGQWLHCAAPSRSFSWCAAPAAVVGAVAVVARLAAVWPVTGSTGRNNADEQQQNQRNMGAAFFRQPPPQQQQQKLSLMRALVPHRAASAVQAGAVRGGMPAAAAAAAEVESSVQL